MPRAFRIRGWLDVEALRRALETVRGRHEVLRSVFRSIDATLVQAVVASGADPLAVVDLSAHAEPVREAEVFRLAEEEAQRPFDLTRGPILRATLLRLSSEEHVLLVTSHRIAFDERSGEIFDRELGALYDAYVDGRPSPLSPLSVQYREFCILQAEFLQREGLRGATRLLEAPARGNAARPRSARKPSAAAAGDFSGGDGGRELGAGLFEAVRVARRTRGRRPFRDAARGLPGASPAALGPRRFRRGLFRGRPAGRIRRVDRAICQQPRLSRQPFGRSDLPRTASPRAGGGGRSRGPSGCPVRKAGGGTQSRADPESPAAVSGHDGSGVELARSAPAGRPLGGSFGPDRGDRAPRARAPLQVRRRAGRGRRFNTRRISSSRGRSGACSHTWRSCCGESSRIRIGGCRSCR